VPRKAHPAPPSGGSARPSKIRNDISIRKHRRGYLAIVTRIHRRFPLVAEERGAVRNSDRARRRRAATRGGSSTKLRAGIWPSSE
jgi:hypothetical protein